MEKIYTVFGSRGEDSDFRMWAVRAFANRDDAEKFCAVLNEITAQYKKNRRSKSVKLADAERQLRDAGDLVSQLRADNSFDFQEIDFGLPVITTDQIQANRQRAEGEKS